MVSELTIAEQTDLWHHMASLNLRQDKTIPETILNHIKKIVHTKPNQTKTFKQISINSRKRCFIKNELKIER
jgi:hypothetical protein